MAKPAFRLDATKRAASRRASRWASTGSRIAVATHDNAPRAGRNLNRYGLRRSAPGDPPAEEEGTLLATLRGGVEADGPGRFVFLVNYSVLETGTDTIEPRPLGRITLGKLKARAKERRGP